MYQPCLRAVTAPWWIRWPTRWALQDEVLGMFPRAWAVCSPALGSQQFVSTQLLIGAGRAGGLSVPERSCFAERQTLVLPPCCGLFSFQSITGDTADKEPVCQHRPWRGESSSLPVLKAEPPAYAFLDHAGHQVRAALLEARSQHPSPARPCPTQPTQHLMGHSSSRANLLPNGDGSV